MCLIVGGFFYNEYGGIFVKIILGILWINKGKRCLKIFGGMVIFI